jgi:hypothetical protein
VRTDAIAVPDRPGEPADAPAQRLPARAREQPEALHWAEIRSGGLGGRAAEASAVDVALRPRALANLGNNQRPPPG